MQYDQLLKFPSLALYFLGLQGKDYYLHLANSGIPNQTTLNLQLQEHLEKGEGVNMYHVKF